MNQPNFIDRRDFLAHGLALAAPLALASHSVAGAETTSADNKICAFVKFVQSLRYESLAETVAELGFDGIEATVRAGGQVLPGRAQDDLPKLVEALRKHDLDVTLMASDVNRVDEPHTETVLQTAARLGIKRYRMKYYRYDLNRPVVDQLRDLRPILKDLVALNRQLGLTAVYQNHAGANLVGAPVWDLYGLVQDYSPDELAVAFDIRHATVEGGLAWPIQFNLIRPHLDTVIVKDFRWHGRRPENVPLGEGQVDPAFFKALRASNYHGPISLHVEYLEDAGVEPNVAALGNDLKTLRTLLQS